MLISAIVFDKDGTLFEFGATWEAWANAFLLRATGNDRERAADIGHHIGFDFVAQKFNTNSVAIAGTPSEIAEVLVPHFPDVSIDGLVNMINQEAESAPQAEAVPLVPLLSQLREKGLKLGVATNDAEIPAMAHLNAAGVVDHFDFIAGFDSGYGAKPEPGQLLAFAQSVGFSPSQIAMVGDSSHDLVAGRNAGMVTVGVLTGMASASDLNPLADVVLPDIGHLPGWLNS